MVSICFPMISTQETPKIHFESPERKCFTLRIRGFSGMDPGLPKMVIPGKRFLRVSSRFPLLGNRFFARERYSFYSCLNQRLTFNDIVNSETFEFYYHCIYHWRIQRGGWGLSGYRKKTKSRKQEKKKDRNRFHLFYFHIYLIVCLYTL